MLLISSVKSPKTSFSCHKLQSCSQKLPMTTLKALEFTELLIGAGCAMVC